MQKYHGKRGTTFKVVWRLPDGSQRAKSFKTRDEAKTFRVEVEGLEQAGRTPDPQRGAVTLRDWSEEYLATLHLKPKSRVTYESLLRSRILPEFGDAPIADITRLDVQKWVAGMAAEVSAARTIAAHAFLSQMLGEAVKHDRLLNNVAEGVKLPKKAKRDVKPLTLDELRIVASHAGRYGPLIMWLGTMGTRWAEAIGLTWDKISDGVVTIDETLSEVEGKFHRVPTKTYEIRHLPVPPALTDELPPQDNEYVFTTSYGNPIRSSHFRTATFLPALEAAKVPQMRIQHLRHTCASLLIQQGANPKVVQVWMGHKDIKVTMDTYSHLFPSDLDDIASKLNELFARGSTGEDE